MDVQVVADVLDAQVHKLVPTWQVVTAIALLVVTVVVLGRVVIHVEIHVVVLVIILTAPQVHLLVLLPQIYLVQLMVLDIRTLLLQLEP